MRLNCVNILKMPDLARFDVHLGCGPLETFPHVKPMIWEP